MFSRIAIVNRGEAAMRLIHAVREYNEEHQLALRTIALHSDAERRAMFVREADEAVRIGAGAGNPYLDYAELERALRESHADAAWVGWGFVAEHPKFAELCDRLGVVFIGPGADVMRALGDKIGAKLLAEQAGVPVAAWSGGPVETLDAARAAATDIGFPVMIKAAAGGGGRGIRRVDHADQLAEAFERARIEAEKTFGDPRVLLEQVVAGARHVEVQIIADHHGTVWAVGVRDCSVQRRNQKLIEESASTALDANQECELRAAAQRLAKLAGYRNAGTVEFLYQPGTRQLAFLEVNTRLQVEHPVTELTTGLDLVKLQLHVAAGGRLEGEPPPRLGHAIEARLNAEDPQRGFAPAPGTVELLSLPSGPGIRVETGVAQGDVVPPEFDSMIAKVLAWGRDRQEARARLKRALAETTAVVRGGTTNKAFLLDLLDHPEVVAGTVDTGWLDRLMASGTYRFPQRLEVALVASAIDVADEAATVERNRFFASAARGRPQTGDNVGHVVDLRHGGSTYRFTVLRTGARRYRVAADDQRIDVDVERLGRFERQLWIGGRRFRVVSVRQGSDELVEVDGIPHRVSQDDGGMVRAPAPGLVVAVTVAPGDRVGVGDRVAVVESMKMEVAVAAPIAGAVREVVVTANSQVEAGAPLLQLEAIADPADDATDAPRAHFQDLAGSEPAADPVARCAARLDALRRLILGFDFPPDDARELVAAYERERSGTPADHSELLRGELGILGVFADLCLLYRNRRVDPENEAEDIHNPREYLHAYLRTLDVDAAGLPETFRTKLLNALAHYGVDELTRSPELEESLYRVYVAQQRTASQLPAVLSLLARRLRDCDSLPSTLEEQFVATLDALISATQLRYPVVGDLARSVRFRCFDEPLIARTRDRMAQWVRSELASLANEGNAPDRDTRVSALVSCPHPLIGLVGERSHDGAARLALLEVLTRRYYAIHPLHNVRGVISEGQPFVTADWVQDGGRMGVVATRTSADDLEQAFERLSAVVAGTGGACVADVYVTTDPSAPGDALPQLASVLDRSAPAERLHRVTVAVVADGVRLFTFRPAGGRFVEDPVLRDLHPMIAERLHLWRLSNFTISRLASGEDAYLFHCVGRDTPNDERLIALAEVRDLTPLRDEFGRVTALPELEHVLATCLDGLRRAQADRPPQRRLHWNRVQLYVWPPVELEVEELLTVVRRLAPTTEGLGLEQVAVQGKIPQPDGSLREVVARISRAPATGLAIKVTAPPSEPLQPLDGYTQKVLQARRRGAVYPYELIPLLLRAHGDPAGADPTFTEYDLDQDGRLVPVDRPYGGNRAGIVVGVVRTPTRRYPEGITRVALLGDPTKALGSLAEPECRRVIAALDLATELQAPVEWFALSAGAKISMDSGTENLDWVARALRRIVEFTQTGGEINVVVAGINVGAQPYWNAEATMLMHTRGILVMTPDSAMVLTGKQALEYSGGVSAEDNFGIGGYDRIMGPNGQAQYWAANLAGACDILAAHYQFAYVAPGERFPRRELTRDPIDRDVRANPHSIDGSDLRTVGEIFSDETNPERKKSFDIRTVVRATVDSDCTPLERWAEMAEAETVVVYDAFLGGHAVTLIGFESRPLPRRGFIPADGPDQWTSGTLFPQSSKKVARAINAASHNRPVVVLANLSGFDGSPESLRKLQLEYGAEIARAVVNFDGPIVFCVISRYHGGAFVVFSAALNDDMEVAALEGSYASVIGGRPAAAVVFAQEVNKRTATDPRIRELERQIAEADAHEAVRLRADAADLRAAVRSEKLSEVAAEFDRVHTVQRAQQVGSVHTIIPPERLRPYLVDAVERGIARTGVSRG